MAYFNDNPSLNHNISTGSGDNQMMLIPYLRDSGITIVTPHLITHIPSHSSHTSFSSPHNELPIIPTPQPTPIHHFGWWYGPVHPPNLQPPSSNLPGWTLRYHPPLELPLPHKSNKSHYSNTSHSSSESPSINQSTEYGSVQNSTGSPYIIVEPENVAEAVSENENIVRPNIQPQIHISIPQFSQQSLPPQIIVNEPNPLSLKNPTTWIIIGLLVILILVIIIEGVRK